MLSITIGFAGMPDCHSLPSSMFDDSWNPPQIQERSSFLCHFGRRSENDKQSWQAACSFIKPHRGSEQPHPCDGHRIGEVQVHLCSAHILD